MIDLYNLRSDDYVAVVDFDHGVGLAPGYPTIDAPSGEFHYMFEDQNGTIFGTQQEYENDKEGHTDPSHGVYDMDVYQALGQFGKVKFAFINTCLSACINDTVGTYNATQRMEPEQYSQYPYYYYPERPIGMPLGWTGSLVKDIDTTQGFNIAEHISADGFSDPDMGSQVYIGFPFGSASLMQKIPYPYGNNPHYYWIYSFFWYALNNDISVNQALDSATAMVDGTYFKYSSLHTGFTAYWWNADPETMEDCTMAVYGNGNIHLKNYAPPSHSVAVRSLNGPSSGDIDVSYQFSASAADSQDHEVRYLFDWGDNTTTLTDYYPSYATINVNHTWSSQDEFSVKVKAQCDNGGVWSDWSNPRKIQIGAFYWLFVDAYWQGMGWEMNPGVYVDNQWVGDAPVSVRVESGYHYVEVDDIWGYWRFVEFSGGLGNPAYIPLYSDTGLTAYYEFQ
jgi:hypothetical protein